MPPLNDDVLIAVLARLDTLGVERASHVDRSWRSVAIGTASLWRVAVLDAKSLDATSRFRTIVRRSGSLPLAVTASIDAPSHPRFHTGPLHLKLLLQTLASERQRICALDLRLGCDHLAGVAGVIAGGFPLLVALDIEMDDPAIIYHDSMVLRFPGAMNKAYAPRVRQFSLTGSRFPPGLHLPTVSSVQVELAPPTDLALERLMVSFPNVVALSLWMPIDFLAPASDSALAVLRRIGNLDELHIHKPWGPNPCDVGPLLAEGFELGAGHVVLHEVVPAQHAAFGLLLQKLSPDERSSLHITLSQVHLARRLYHHSEPPALYQVHALSASSGHTRAVTFVDYYLAVQSAVLPAVQMDGCTEITLVGDAGWSLFCGAHELHAPSMHHLQTLRIVLSGLPLPSPRRQSRALRPPALETVVLRAAPELGCCVRVDAKQMVELLRWFEVEGAARLDVQTVCITVDGELDRFPAHMTLNGKEPNPAISAQVREPVEADELFLDLMYLGSAVNTVAE